MGQQLLLAEDLILLRVDAPRGRIKHSRRLRTVIGGALLVDLALADALDVPPGSHEQGGPVVTTIDDVDDPLLRRMAEAIADQPRSAWELVRAFSAESEDVLAGLVDRGHLRKGQRPRGIGHLFGDSWKELSAHRWTLGNQGITEGLRSSVMRVLVDGVEPDPRVAVVIALLDATDASCRVLDLEGRRLKEAERRASRIAVRVVDDGLAGAAAGRAVQATQYVAWTTIGDGPVGMT